jgi:fimbrial chaperone protein
MRARKITVALAAGLAALCALPVPAVAGNFSISPLRVAFGQGSGTAALTVRNEDSAPVVIQAEGFAWSQDGGQEALAPTRDLLISPAVFTVPPGGSQLVRVALRRALDPTRELSYRLTLQEVPPAVQQEFTGLQVALRMSVPIFVAPSAAAAPQVVWQGQRGADGRLVVAARNDGTAHERVRGFAVKTADGAVTVFEQPVMAYVLPGAERRWTFDNKNDVRTSAGSSGSATAGPYRLEGTTDRGAFTTELLFPAR